MNRANFVSGAIGVAIGGGALAGATGFPPDVVMKIGPAFFPEMLASALIALSAVLMIGAVREAPGGDAAQPPPFRLSLEDGRVRAVLTAFAVLAFTLVLKPLGFVVSSVLFLAAMMAMLGVRRPATLAGVALGVTFGVWLIFEKLLVLSLPAGILDGFLFF